MSGLDVETSQTMRVSVHEILVFLHDSLIGAS